MKYYPILMDVKGVPCLVVGGGGVGSRKAFGLIRAGARVTVVSPVMSPELEQAAAGDPRLELRRRAFALSDLSGMRLAFAATDNKRLNAEVRTAAARAGVLCNAADGEDKGDFILPSVVDRGDLILAISTCGTSPALAKRLRQHLEKEFGPEYAMLARLLAGVRQRLLDQGHDPEGHKQVFTSLVEENLAGLLAAQDRPAVDRILGQVLGDGFSCAALGIEEP